MKKVLIISALLLLLSACSMTEKNTNEDTIVSSSELEVPDNTKVEDGKPYTVEYYADVDSNDAEDLVTMGVTGEKTKIATLEELGIEKQDSVFEGWRLYREVDDKWFLRNRKGNSSWMSLEDGELPSGYSFDFRADGAELIQPTTEGIVRLYAQWGGQEFRVVYHLDTRTQDNGYSTVVKYGEETPSLTLQEMNMDLKDADFKGWRLFREVDNKWSVKDSNGNLKWVNLKNGKLPEGYQFKTYDEGFSFVKAATSGVVHAYAQWENGEFTVEYHENENTDAAEKTTLVHYGKLEPILSVNELEFDTEKRTFEGWKLYREIDDSWSAVDENGVLTWVKLENNDLPSGYSYALYGEETQFTVAAPSGVVHAYAQWN